MLADVYRQRGLGEAGWRILQEALALVEQHLAEAYYKPEIYRLKGEMLLALSPDHQAEASTCFQQAMEIARDQQARSWELRAAVSFSRLCQHQGQCEAACALLEPVYAWFTEGFDTADLREARALLESLT
jgi:predicted ATPase